MLDALAAVRAAGVGGKEDFYWTLHAVFVKRHEHSVLFDQAFKIFFRKRGYLERLIAMMSPEMTGAPAQAEEPQASQRVLDALFQGAEKIEREKQEIELDARFTVSDREVLEKKDFAQMSAAEIAAGQGRHQAHGAGLRRGQDAAARRRIRTATASICAARLRASMKGGGALIDLKYRGAEDQAAAGRRAARYLRLDEPVHAAVPAFPPRRHRCAKARAHLPVRHAADQRDAGAEGERPGRGAGGLLGERARLVGRHADRDLACACSTSNGRAGC